MRVKWRWLGGLVPLALWVTVLMPADADAAGAVSGTVRPVAWAQEVEVCVVEAQPSETCTAPESDGSYRLAEIQAERVRLEFLPSFRSRLLAQYYDHKSSLGAATTIVLLAPGSEAHDIDADLVEGGAIGGTVTAAANGLPLAEVEVCAASTTLPAADHCAETDASGVYELHSLPGGSYEVAFRGRGKSAEYAPSNYDGKQIFDQATPVGVTEGETTSGIDASLEKGAEIEGSVTEMGGAPLPGTAVCLFAVAAPTAERCTYADEAGAYSFEGLAIGSYQVGFSLEPGEFGAGGGEGESDGFESQFFDGVPTRAQGATITVLAPSLVAGVDAILFPPPEPPAVIPPPPVANPIVPAPPTIAEPKPCGEGRQKRKVKGKVRCVRVRKGVRRHHHRKHAHQGKGKGKKG